MTFKIVFFKYKVYMKCICCRTCSWPVREETTCET